jgi:hypothetical protein
MSFGPKHDPLGPKAEPRHCPACGAAVPLPSLARCPVCNAELRAKGSPGEELVEAMLDVIGDATGKRR